MSHTDSTNTQNGPSGSVSGLPGRLGRLSGDDLVSALRADQSGRWRAGHGVPAEAYLAAFPEVAASPDDALVLIGGEVVLRFERGEEPALAEYADRFPKLAEAIALQFEVQAHFGGRSTVSAVPSARVPPPEPPPGYEILGELGRGGMGVVYKARHLSLNRVVALKMIRPDVVPDPNKAVRFRQEAELTARLQHANVVQVYEIGGDAGRMFLAMEFVDGPTLAQKVAGAPFAPAAAARLIETLAAAVHEAHRLRIVHRDLKPGNILLTADGVPKVTDFGLAKWDIDGGLTQTGAVLGTPSYMAPEQAVGDAARIGPATDVYGLGAVLYECLTGRPPFRGGTPLETLRRVENQEPDAVRAVRPEVPRDLETICHKCLEKRPDRRYASTAALAEDLQRFQAGRPVAARPIGAVGRAARWARRNPGWAAAVSIAAALLGTIAVGGVGAAVYLDQKRQAADLARAEAVGARTEADAARAEAADKYWHSLVDRARAERNSRRVGQRFETLRAVREAYAMRPSGDLRSEALAALCLPDVEVAAEWDGHPNGTQLLTFDATCERFARIDRSGTISICRRVPGGEEVVGRVCTGSEPPFTSLSLSPDGRYVVVGLEQQFEGTAGRVCVWRAEDAARVLDSTRGLVLSGVSFRSGSRQVALAHADGHVGVYDLPSGRPERVFAAAGVQVAFHPADGRVAVAGGDRVRVFDADTGREHPPLVAGTARPRANSVAWHPDGRRLAAGCDDERVHVWNADTAAEDAAPFAGHNTLGLTIAFNPTGDRLLSNGWDEVPHLWDTATGRVVLKLPGLTATRFGPKDLLAHTRVGTRVKLWRLAAGREVRVLQSKRAGSDTDLYCPAVHPNGRLLAAATLATLNWFDLDTGEEISAVQVPGSQQAFPRFFDPNGDLVTYGFGTGTRVWPVAERSAPGLVRYGPPGKIGTINDKLICGYSRNRKWLAYPLHTDTILTHRDRPEETITLGPQYDVRNADVSPDGLWVFTGSFWTHPKEPAAKVWNLTTGKPVRDLPVPAVSVSGLFSPDGRYLATYQKGTGTQLWQVGTWHLVGGRGNGPFCFREDGKVMAVAERAGEVRLVETATGRELARLTAPDPVNLTPLCFTPDGGRLIVSPNPKSALIVWDIRTLRRQLAGLGLDWDDPAGSLPDVPLDPTRPQIEMTGLDRFRSPTPIEVVASTTVELLTRPSPDLHFRRGMALAGLGMWVLAEGDFDRAVGMDPRHLNAIYRRGRARMVLGDMAGAVADLTQVIDQPRVRSPARIYRSVALDALGRTAEASIDRTAVPSVVGEYRRYARDHHDTGDTRMAVLLYSAVLSAEPTDHATCHTLATLLLTGPNDLRDATRALTLARRAVAARPDDPGYRTTLGITLYRSGKFQAAVTELTHPEGRPDPAALYGLAMCWHRLGALERAGEAFGRAEERRREGALTGPGMKPKELAALREEALELLFPSPRK